MDRHARLGAEIAGGAAALAVAAALAIITGCTSAATGPPPPSSAAAPVTSAPMPHQVSDPGKVTGTLAGQHCAFRGTEPGILPDPACTPGAYDPHITAKVLCDPAYTTRAYRPPVYQTSRFKLEQAYPAYGVPAGTPSELDHLINLDLGGANDAANLWPEIGSVPNPKDRTEARLHAWVCAARGQPAESRLAAARQAIAADWPTALDVLGIK